MTVVYWAALSLAGLLAVVLALLAVPVDVRGRMAANAALSWTVQIRWLFGLVRFERGSASPHPAEPVLAEQASAEPRRRQRAARRTPAFVKEPVVWRRAVRLLRSSLRGLTLRRVDAQLRFGLDDPADTGYLFGVLSLALIFIRSAAPGPVAVAPDFEQAGLSGRAAGELRIVPLRVLAPVAAFGVWLGLHTWQTRRRP